MAECARTIIKTMCFEGFHFFYLSSCPAGHLRHRAYCVLCSLSSLSPCLLVSLSPCRPVSLSLFFSYESLAETKPTKPQKLQKRNIQNCSKIMQNRCPWGHFGVILVSIWCPWGSFGDPGRPRGPPKGTEAKKRRKRAFADPPPGTPFGDPWATWAAIGPTFSSFLGVG